MKVTFFELNNCDFDGDNYDNNESFGNLGYVTSYLVI